jgi:hypothetical protein
LRLRCWLMKLFTSGLGMFFPLLGLAGRRFWGKSLMRAHDDALAAYEADEGLAR